MGRSTRVTTMEGSILLIGASGMLGRAWREVLDHAGVAYDAPTRSDLDISQTVSIQRYIDGRPVDVQLPMIFGAGTLLLFEAFGPERCVDFSPSRLSVH